MSKRGRRKRVAVVEDHDDIRFLLQVWLSQRFEVAVFESGEELLGAIDSVAPDLVIMDLNMPGRDGLQIAAAMRTPQSRWRRLPVLFLSGTPRSGFGAALGDPATAFLSKPLQLSFLRDSVERLLDQTARAPGAVDAR